MRRASQQGNADANANAKAWSEKPVQIHSYIFITTTHTLTSHTRLLTTTTHERVLCKLIKFHGRLILIRTPSHVFTAVTVFLALCCVGEKGSEDALLRRLCVEDHDGEWCGREEGCAEDCSLRVLCGRVFGFFGLRFQEERGAALI